MSKTTRHSLLAENAALRAQLAAAKPESRQGLRRRIATVTEENKRLALQNESLAEQVKKLARPPVQEPTAM